MYDHIITSGESSYHSLEQYKGQSIYCFEDYNSPKELGELNLKQVSSPANADIAIMYDLRHNSVEPYRGPLSQCLDNDLKIICANPDRIVDVGGQIIMCAGTLADLYEDMGGKVEWHGKPHAPVYEWAYELLERPDKSKILAIGDSIRTDVTGASQFGIDVLWNAVGIHLHEITTNGKIDIEKAKGAFDEHTPTAILDGLAW